MTYTMSCDDGFMVTSKSKDEAASMAAMHVMLQHPKMKVSMEDMEKKVEKM